MQNYTVCCHMFMVIYATSCSYIFCSLSGDVVDSEKTNEAVRKEEGMPIDVEIIVLLMSVSSIQWVTTLRGWKSSFLVLKQDFCQR